MRKIWVIFLVVLLLIIVAGAFLLVFIALKNWVNQDKEKEPVSVSLYVKDKSTKEFVSGKIYIYQTEEEVKGLFKNIRTVKGKEKIYLDKGFNYVFVVGNDDYYKITKNVSIEDESPDKIDLNFFLNEKGEVFIEVPENLSLNLGWNDFIVNISSEKYLKGLIICFEYGYGVEGIIPNLAKLNSNLSIPSKNCYGTVRNLNYGESFSFVLNYDLKEKTDFSFIKIMVYDQDINFDESLNMTKRKEIVVPEELGEEKYNL